MSSTSTLTRLFQSIYRIILPATVTLLFFVVPQFLKRPLFFGSMVVDVGVRLWLTLCFIASYIIVSDLNRYRTWFYGGRTQESNQEGETITAMWNVALGVMFGALGFLLTHWLVRFFLPFLDRLVIPIAAVNGALLTLPFIIHRRRMIF